MHDLPRSPDARASGVGGGDGESPDVLAGDRRGPSCLALSHAHLEEVALLPSKVRRRRFPRGHDVIQRVVPPVVHDLQHWASEDIAPPSPGSHARAHAADENVQGNVAVAQ
eukprot:9020531-Pyramimonas_sp.AAC.1